MRRMDLAFAVVKWVKYIYYSSSKDKKYTPKIFNVLESLQHLLRNSGTRPCFDIYFFYFLFIYFCVCVGGGGRGESDQKVGHQNIKSHIKNQHILYYTQVCTDIWSFKTDTIWIRKTYNRLAWKSYISLIKKFALKHDCKAM